MGDNIAQDALDADRVRRAVLLRAQGAHYDEIARECGYPSPAAAVRAVGEAMAASTARATETADQQRDTAQLRLEILLRDALSMIAPAELERYDNEGNPMGPEDDRAVRLRAVDEARRLVGDISKLQRLDKVSDSDGDDVTTVRIVGLDPLDMI